MLQTFEWNSVCKNTIGSTQQLAERIVHVAAADRRTLMHAIVERVETRGQRLRVASARDFIPVFRSIGLAFASERSGEASAVLGR